MRIVIAFLCGAALTSCSPATFSSPLPSEMRAGPSTQPHTSSTYKSLYSFKGGSDGAYPHAGLIALNGTLYGTTASGGTYSSTCSGGCGTVFSLSMSGHEHVVYRFKGGSDGAGPGAGLTALKETLYGTTATGGADDCPFGSYGSKVGCGTVFSVDASGKETVLYRFKGGRDGAEPNGLIVVDGSLYGTTGVGGGCSDWPYGCGTFFKVSTSGREQVLYRFSGYSGSSGTDGTWPIGTLLFSNGAFYGIGSGGELWCISYPNIIPCGLAFKVSTSGKEQVLHQFGSTGDGAFPDGGFVRIGGTLYGATGGGGSGYCGFGLDGCGTVFTLSTAGKEQILYSFTGPPDGDGANAPLAVVNSALYGTTGSGGSYCKSSGGCGTIFSVSTSAEERLLYSFKAAPHGGIPFPNGGLEDLNGTLYGTTCCGGTADQGNAFSISP